MKARVIKHGTWWYGEIYGTWYNILLGEYTGWAPVTNNCCTSIGAKIALNSYIKANYPKEFEI